MTVLSDLLLFFGYLCMVVVAGLACYSLGLLALVWISRVVMCLFIEDRLKMKKQKNSTEKVF